MTSNYRLSKEKHWKVLFEEWKSSGNIFVDESPINVQVPGGVQKGYMWVIVGGNEANPPYRIYDFAEDRCHAHIFKILNSYTGVLHSDKYRAVRHEVA